jgi:F-type H+-transporting ATPase subunit a
MHVSIKAETIFTLFGVPVTNAMLLGIAGMLFLICWMLFVARKAKHDVYVAQAEAARDGQTDGAEQTESDAVKRDGFFTRLAVWCFEGLYKTVIDTVPDKKVARRVAPFVISIFFIVAIQYYTGILPFVGEAITVHGVPLLRSQAADLNFTLTLAIITIIAVQVWAFKALGVSGNLKRYFVNPLKKPIDSFAGFLELIGEFSRMLALAMRLFGNVFAGEVLLIVVAYLTSYASPLLLPFFFIFELFVGGIQAYVFFMLATVFIALPMSHGGEHATAKTSPDHSSPEALLTEASEIS